MSKANETMGIEALVTWAYRDQCVDQAMRQAGGREVRWLAGGGSNVAAIGGMLALGTMIDGGAGLHAAPELAERVHAAVEMLPRTAADLVTRHGRTGSRPTWEVDTVLGLVPVRNGNGAVKVLRAWDGDAREWVRHCPVEIDFDLRLVEVVRLRWLAWWDALAVVASRLGVAAPDCDREPWQAKPLRFIA